MCFLRYPCSAHFVKTGCQMNCRPLSSMIRRMTGGHHFLERVASRCRDDGFVLSVRTHRRPPTQCSCLSLQKESQTPQQSSCASTWSVKEHDISKICKVEREQHETRRQLLILGPLRIQYRNISTVNAPSSDTNDLDIQGPFSRRKFVKFIDGASMKRRVKCIHCRNCHGAEYNFAPVEISRGTCPHR